MPHINIYSIPPMLGAALSLLLAGVVAINARKNKANYIFCCFCLAMFFWLASYAISYSTKSVSLAILCTKIACTAVSFTSLFIYAFVVYFLGINEEKKLVQSSIILGAFFLYAFTQTNIFLDGVHHYFWGFYSRAGLLHPFYLAINYTILIRCFFLLLRAMKANPNSNQIKYFFIAYTIAIPATVDYIPKYGIEFYPFGYIFVLSFGLIITYAILKHKLLDIEIIIRRTAVFAGLFTFVYGLFMVVTVIGQEFFKNRIGWNQWAAMIPTVVIVTFALRPIETMLTNATDKYLFQKKYDYKDLLKTFTDEVLTVLDLQELPQKTVAGLIRILKLESASIFIKDIESDTFTVLASSGLEPNLNLSGNHLFINKLSSVNYLLFDRTEPAPIREIFKELNAQLCLSISLDNRLIGLLFLGMKKSGADFSTEDIDILITLAKTEAIAISNAQLFDELSKTQAEAAQREKMAVIGTLAAGINHEICNPLGIVRGHSEMFLLNVRDGLYKEKSAEELLKICSDILSKVIKETDRATAITKKLSGFAKPSKRSDLEEVVVEKETDEVIGLLGHDLKLNNIEIMKDFPADYPVIIADKKQIQEVLFNIIRNAAQAMDKRNGKIALSGFKENGFAVIRIADNGSGIPKEKISQIFNPFYTTKAPGKGTGLGLFIVKQVVEKNKGTIAVESSEGIGTTFTLKFPTAAGLTVLAN